MKNIFFVFATLFLFYNLVGLCHRYPWSRFRRSIRPLHILFDQFRAITRLSVNCHYAVFTLRPKLTKVDWITRQISIERQHGRECVRLPTAGVLIRCFDAPNSNVFNCSTPPTMTFFTVSRHIDMSKLTLTTSSGHTCLTRLTYRTSFEPALTQW